jgi:uncharacterized damage-inducible protein DinB
MISKPAPGEYAPYYEQYVREVPEGDILQILAAQNRETQRLLEEIGEKRAGYRYAPGKWSIKEIIGHITDSERIFTYRALAFARADSTALPSFEQDDYVRSGNFAARTLRSLGAEFAAVRAAALTLFESLDRDSLERRGRAAGNDVSVRAFPYIVAGHERHHINVIHERYMRGIEAA